VGGDVHTNSEVLLMTDFMNLKIKPAQSFRGAHRSRVYVCVYKCECSYICEYLHLYSISKKSGLVPLYRRWLVGPKSKGFIRRFTRACVLTSPWRENSGQYFD
jgi:hypothetical protein